ncbi:hypothetical protein BpHYR1_006067, partial [Brachionus plicatilis]
AACLVLNQFDLIGGKLMYISLKNAQKLVKTHKNRLPRPTHRFLTKTKENKRRVCKKVDPEKITSSEYRAFNSLSENVSIESKLHRKSAYKVKTCTF